jgi:hypothetical protein
MSSGKTTRQRLNSTRRAAMLRDSSCPVSLREDVTTKAVTPLG